MTFTKDQMRAVAEKVYPQYKWELNGNGDPATLIPSTNWPGENYTHVFKPELDGLDWQQAQACQCIVAAMSLPSTMSVQRYSKGYAIEYWSKTEDCGIETPVCPDILTASIAALLAST